MQLMNFQTVEELKKSHSGWVEEALRSDRHVRESKWVQSVAVGSEEFVEMTKEKLGIQVKGRSVSRSGDDYQLREQQAAYSAHFAPENAPLSDDNTCYWNISGAI
jgi:putative transposase